MPYTRQQIEKIKAAKSIAKSNGLFVVESGNKFLLYRESKPRNVYLGFRCNPSDLHSFVASRAATKPAEASK